MNGSSRAEPRRELQITTDHPGVRPHNRHRTFMKRQPNSPSWNALIGHALARCGGAVLMLLTTGGSVHGQTWDANVGNWFASGNWTPSIVPTTTSRVSATISNGGTANIGSPGAVARSVVVGGASPSALNISSGGTLIEGSVTDRGGGAFSGTESRIGGVANTTGNVTVSGAGSRWESNGLSFDVGDDGAGKLRILSGGTVLSPGGNIGGSSTGVGSVTVSGSGSLWQASGGPFTPLIRVGNQGHGELTVTDGGEVKSFGLLVAAAFSGAVGEGSVFVTNGGKITDSASSTIGSGGIAYASVSGANSRWTSGAIEVAHQGVGTFEILDGGTVITTSAGGSTDYSSVGLLSGAQGAVMIDGAGSRWESNGDFFLGFRGEGSLMISGGGKLDVNTTVASPYSNLVIGYETSGQGAAVVTDAGSELNAANALQIGLAGEGSLTVANGGKVTSAYVTIGDSFSSGTGTVNVTGQGSVLETTAFGGIAVGNAQSALNILDGGKVSSYRGSSGGLVSINGTNSAWEVASDFTVAGGLDDTTFGTSVGQISITAGGRLTAQEDSIISLFVGSQGTAIVGGANSLWRTMGDFYIGYGEPIPAFYYDLGFIPPGTVIGNGLSDAELTIRNGGTVQVGGRMILGNTAKATGRLIIGGSDAGAGTLIASEVHGGPGIAEVHFDHGDAAYSFDAQITGSTSVFHSGSGQTALTAHHTYTGLTQITGGALLVNGSIASPLTTIGAGGTLGGTGTVGGNLVSHGTISPGTSPGTLTIGGDVTLASDGALRMEIAGRNAGEFDVLSVGGELTLGGTLEIDFLNGFLPEAGDVFDFITHGGLAGQFDGFTVGGVSPAWTFSLVSNGSILSLRSESDAQGLDVLVTPGGTTTITHSTQVSDAQQIIFQGGTLVIGGNLALPNPVVVQTSGTIYNNAGTTLTFTGPFTGTGTFTKAGAGTLIFAARNSALDAFLGSNGFVDEFLKRNGFLDEFLGRNDFLDEFLVDEGSVIVDGFIPARKTYINPFASISGSGYLPGRLYNSGLVSPGRSPGTLLIGGDYIQSSTGTLRIEVGGTGSGEFDRLIVGGRANLDGTLELVRLNDFKLKRGDRIEFLMAAQGVDGEFAQVINPFESRTILVPKVVYEDNAVMLTLVQGSFAEFAESRGLTPNQRAVAGALDAVAFDSRADKMITYLDDRLLEKLPADFDEIAPEELASALTISTALANVQALNVQRRTDDLRRGSAGFDAFRFAMNGASPGYSGNLWGAAGPTGDSGKGRSAVNPPEDQRWGAFLSGVGEWVNVQGDGNARGYDLATGGFTLGLDYKVSPNFAVGIAAGYAGTAADLTGDGRIEVNGGKLGVYATAFAGGWYADAAVSGGYNSYDTRRTALQGSARGSTDGGELERLRRHRVRLEIRRAHHRPDGDFPIHRRGNGWLHRAWLAGAAQGREPQCGVDAHRIWFQDEPRLARGWGDHQAGTARRVAARIR